MNPNTTSQLQPHQRYRMIAAAPTTSKATSAKAPQTNSKLVRNDLRYVPVVESKVVSNQKSISHKISITGNRTAVPAPIIAPWHAPGGSKPLLAILPSSKMRSAGNNYNGGAGGGDGALPSLAFLKNTSAVDVVGKGGSGTLVRAGNLQQQRRVQEAQPRNVVLAGADGTPALATACNFDLSRQLAICGSVAAASTGLGGSLIIRNQATTAAALQQRMITSVGLPVLNQELVKQIVVGNGPSPRTLLRAQPTQHQQKVALLHQQQVNFKQQVQQQTQQQPQQNQEPLFNQLNSQLHQKQKHCEQNQKQYLQQYKQLQPQTHQQVQQVVPQKARPSLTPPKKARQQNFTPYDREAKTTSKPTLATTTITAAAKMLQPPVGGALLEGAVTNNNNNNNVTTTTLDILKQQSNGNDTMMPPPALQFDETNHGNTIGRHGGHNFDNILLPSNAFIPSSAHSTDEPTRESIAHMSNGTAENTKEAAQLKSLPAQIGSPKLKAPIIIMGKQNPRTKRSQSLHSAQKVQSAALLHTVPERRRCTLSGELAHDFAVALREEAPKTISEVSPKEAISEDLRPVANQTPLNLPVAHDGKVEKTHMAETSIISVDFSESSTSSLNNNLEIEIVDSEDMAEALPPGNAEPLTNQGKAQETSRKNCVELRNEQHKHREGIERTLKDDKLHVGLTEVPVAVHPKEMPSATSEAIKEQKESQITCKMEVAHVENFQITERPTEKKTTISTLIDMELSIARSHIKVEPSETAPAGACTTETMEEQGRSQPKEEPNKCSNDVESQPQLDKTLLICDEQIQISPPLSSFSSSLSGGSHSLATAQSQINDYSSVLNMLSAYNMLEWKDRVGSVRGTPLRFQLNEFNLLVIHERCPPRSSVPTAYEKPISDRQPSKAAIEGDETAADDPLLYLCRRCNGHGPATNFLAPGFCSVECLKRESRKRPRSATNSRKRPRKEHLTMPAIPPPHDAADSALTKKYFRWSTYLRGRYTNLAAPIDHFLNPFPTGPNQFEIGMKLEAIDPENCSLFCVCTVVQKHGYRLRLHFDGYDSMYNFWINADSMDIFPPGWCARTNRVLQPPKGMDPHKFNWITYLEKKDAHAAQRQFFTHLNSSALPTRNPFKVGMHLEAEDLNDTGKLCVATVADVLEERIRIHFDGWDNCYDYWVDISSPYIHPCGWHEGRQQLIVPPKYDNNAFHWSDYIGQQKSGTAAPAEFFEARDAIDFRPLMKLEVVDPRNPMLIRPSSVVMRKMHRVKLHLDCYPTEYCFWVEDDSADMHPIGWCDATGHDLEPPPGFHMRPLRQVCKTVGCRGLGNAKYFQSNSHSTRDCCPYAPENWRQKVEKPPRVNTAEIWRPSATPGHAERINKSSRKPQHQHQHDVTAVRRRSTNRNFNDKQMVSQSEMLDHKPTLRPGVTQSPQCKANNGKAEVSADVNIIPAIYIKQEVPVVEATTATTAPLSGLNGSEEENDVKHNTAELNIAKQFLCDYGPRLRHNYEIWQRHLSFDWQRIRRNPLLWTTAETCKFVEHILQCPRIAANFEREDIDGSALLLLQQADLSDMLGLRLGPAVKLFAHILHLRTMAVCTFNSGAAATSASVVMK